MREGRQAEEAYRAVLDRLAALGAADAVDWCEARLARTPADPLLLGLRSLSEYFAQRYDAATATAAEARAAAGRDPLERMLALAVSGLARSGTVTAAGSGTDHLALAGAELDSLDEMPASIRPVIAHLLTEAALACGRLDLAEGIVAQSADLPGALLPSDDAGSPYLGVMRVTRVRLLTFRGRITEALALGERAVAEADGPAMRVLAEATLCLVQGNAAERATVHALAERVTPPWEARTTGSRADVTSSSPTGWSPRRTSPAQPDSRLHPAVPTGSTACP